MAKPKILAWDIEATHLDANIGRMLCVGYKWLGESKVHIISIGDNPKFGRAPKDTINDKEVARRMGDVIGQADMQIHHFGTYFDEKFVNTRLLYHGLPPVPVVPRIDTWWIAKSKLRLNSNRLATLQQFLKLPTEKTPLNWDTWALAGAGDRRALGEIIHHCKNDVLVLEQAYNKLRPLISIHPNLSLLLTPGKCPICGNGELQKRGIRIMRTSMAQRYQCQKCHGWSAMPLKSVSRIAR